MTVQDTNIVFSSTANGVTKAFPMTNCLVYDETHIKVEVDKVLKTLATDYTVSGVGLPTGPTVNFLAAPSDGATVIRYRSVPYGQQTDLVNYEGPPLEVIESMVDLTVMQTAQLAEITNRSFRFPIGESYNAEFPPLSESAGKYLFRNADGTIGASTGTTATPVSSAMETFVGSTTLAAARTELDVYSKSESDALIPVIPEKLDVVKVTVLTGNGTYTPDANLKYAHIEAVGGGGAGGGCALTGAGQSSAGGGGGGAEYRKGLFTAATVGTSPITVTMGTAGAGSTGAGTSGGNTSVGALLVANGGAGGTAGTASGGVANTTGGTGGTGGSGGTIAVPGQPGMAGLAYPIATYGYGYGGAGGSSLLGHGAQGFQYASGGTGTAAKAYGAGGSGAGNAISQGTARAGGNGSAGIVIITEYCTA